MIGNNGNTNRYNFLVKDVSNNSNYGFEQINEYIDVLKTRETNQVEEWKMITLVLNDKARREIPNY